MCNSSQCLTSLDHRFSDEIDKLAVYKTKPILCMAIHNSNGEVIGVVQAINKNRNGAPFTEDDEKDHRFSDEIDKLAVYKTKPILCMAIHNSNGEVIGVVQAINKNRNGAPFTEDDEKGHNIFDNLCSKEYSCMMQLLKQAILSTDLTLYIQ
ncbi:UNVERIFIED_CONTAM: hypothetical protein FKN15_052825 [Acipenser sinensis]